MTDRGLAQLQSDLPRRSVGRVVARPGTAFDEPLRHEFGARFARDLTTVRVHTDPDAAATAVGLGASAYSVGHHVVFAPGRFDLGTADGRQLLTHELAHVAATDTTEVDLARISRPGDPAERAAAHAADHVRAGRVAPAAQAAPGIHRQAVADPFAVIDAGPLTAATAKGLLDHYATLTDPDRDAVIRAHHRVGVLASGVARWLAALDRADVTARRDLIRDIQERVQRLAVEGVTGKNLAHLGRQQAAFRASHATARAQRQAADAAARTGRPAAPVTDADIARAQDEEAAAVNPLHPPEEKGWWEPETKESWNARAAAVIPKVVAACGRIAPDLGITAKNVQWAPEIIARRGGNVFALSGDPIKVGTSFVRLAELDPDYVVRTVAHELRGHPDFGEPEPGPEGTFTWHTYEPRIHEESHRQEPALGKPWDTPGELKTFGRVGTEIYAAMRELPYEQPFRPTSGSGAPTTFTHPIGPAANVDSQIKIISEIYAPGVAEGVVQGLYERFRIDPRISQDALAVFEEAAERYFPKALKGVPDRPPWPGLGARLELGTEWSGGRVRPHAGLAVNVAARWAHTALSAGIRLDVSLQDRTAFVRAGVQGGVEQRLFRALYFQANLGYLHGFGSATSGVSVSGGPVLRFGSTELGLVFDYLKSTAAGDPDAQRLFLTLGLRL